MANGGGMNDNPLMAGLFDLAGQQQAMADQQMQGAKPKPPNPVEMIQAGLLAVSMGLKQLGMEETALKVVQLVQKSLERMTKMTAGGRQEAALDQGMPPATPPGIGPLPGTPIT